MTRQHSQRRVVLSTVRALFVACVLLGISTVGCSQDRVTLGAGAYWVKPHGGLTGGDPLPPSADYRTGEAATQAAPTNQWYSSVMFVRNSFPIEAHPLTYRATAAGFELGLPDRQLVTTDSSRREVRYAHRAALTVTSPSVTATQPKLLKHADWLAQIRYASDTGATLDATVLHGSPFSYYELSSGEARIRLADAATPIAKDAPDRDPRVTAFTLGGHSYAVFAPTGATHTWVSPTELQITLPTDKHYFSIAGLPDNRPETVKAFLAVAYAFPVDTRATYRFDQDKSTITTHFAVSTVAREGTNTATFMGLYPHHWSAISTHPQSAYSYDTVRGTVRLLLGTQFDTTLAYGGFVPVLPKLQDAEHNAAVNSLLVGDNAKAEQLYLKKGRGTYWIGKGLGATAQLLSIAEAQGKTGMRDDLLAQTKDRLKSWFDGQHATYFLQDSRLGTFVGYPQEYNSVSAMNDHHFHYGYWLMAAAHVALRDPTWASDTTWGPMVNKLVADIATDERGRTDFPYLRNFDPYEGHSWASGDAGLEDGNNQESSSEAINAWAALILWGEATGNTHIRDLGIYLYTSEIASVRTYWFDLNHEVLAREFAKPFASMVFGGKYSYNTWWTEEPRQIMGINIVPITPASTYLGIQPDYVRGLLTFLPAEQKRYSDHGVVDGTPADIWQDVLAAFQALADPDGALKAWDKHGSVEFGETRSHTLYWLLSLKELGTPDFSIQANTTLYAVFRAANGSHTYLAYNAHDTALQVKFSDGATLEVAPHALGKLSDSL